MIWDIVADVIFINFQLFILMDRNILHCVYIQMVIRGNGKTVFFCKDLFITPWKILCLVIMSLKLQRAYVDNKKIKNSVKLQDEAKLYLWTVSPTFRYMQLGIYDEVAGNANIFLYNTYKLMWIYTFAWDSKSFSRDSIEKFMTCQIYLKL